MSCTSFNGSNQNDRNIGRKHGSWQDARSSSISLWKPIKHQKKSAAKRNSQKDKETNKTNIPFICRLCFGISYKPVASSTYGFAGYYQEKRTKPCLFLKQQYAKLGSEKAADWSWRAARRATVSENEIHQIKIISRRSLPKKKKAKKESRGDVNQKQIKPAAISHSCLITADR